MNLYTSLTIRYLKENKRRTLVTIIGIILSTALICGIGNICMSLLDYEMRSAISSNSDFYASFYDLNKKDHVVDFGCGKGRLIFYINYYFKCIASGIEFKKY